MKKLLSIIQFVFSWQAALILMMLCVPLQYIVPTIAEYMFYSSCVITVVRFVKSVSNVIRIKK